MMPPEKVEMAEKVLWIWPENHGESMLVYLHHNFFQYLVVRQKRKNVGWDYEKRN
jgi:hypothetical protein